MTAKNEYIVKLETLIAESRAQLDQEAAAGQAEIDNLQDQIDALEIELVPLPGKAKSLRNQGAVRQARELTEAIEELNIKIARLQVQKARLEAARLTEVSRKFSALIPEVSAMSREGAIAAEEAKRQAQIDFETIMSYGRGITNLAWAFYGQPAAQAQERLEEAQRRLNTAVDGGVKLAAAS